MCLKKTIRIIIVSFFVLLLFNSANADDYVWVSSMNAKLKKERSAASKTLSNLPIHTRLNVKSLVKRWYFVETSEGVNGWIYRGKVTDIPPKEEKIADASNNNLFGNIFGEMMESDIESDTHHTDRSIRGLSADNRYEKKKGMTDEGKEYARMTAADQKYQKALDNLLKMNITDKELNVFLKQGKIGEYAQ